MKADLIAFLAKAIFAATLTLAASAANAGDAAARHVVGFSPDGSIFAFEQYTMLYEDEAAFSEYVIIDTRHDRFLPGTPLKVLLRGDDGLDEKKAREDAAQRVAPLLATHGITAAGERFAGQPSMELDDIGIYQMSDTPLAPALDFTLKDGRRIALKANGIAIGKALCAGVGGRGVAGKADVRGLKLTMQIDGAAPAVLHNDSATKGARLPPRRRCAGGYGIAEAHAYVAPDRSVTLAVLVEYTDYDDFHAGPNRRFMAVTTRLPPR